MRRIYFIAIAAAVVVFLVISALLARVLSANSAEQSAITALVNDEARGDAAAIIGDIDGCRAEPACTRRARQLAGALTRQGKVSIINLQPSTSFSVAGTQGTARVAWSVGQLPIVQCIRVRRTGNAIGGLRVELLAVSPRIKSDTACPHRF